MATNQGLSDNAYPSEVTTNPDPTAKPTQSLSSGLPPNQDSKIKDYEQKINPVKASGSESVAQGNVSVGKEGEHGTGEVGGRPEDEQSQKENSSLKDKVKSAIGKS